MVKLKNIWAIVLLPILSNAMDDTSKNMFAKFIVLDSTHLIEQSLLNGADPNGTTPLGTPFVTFVNSWQALSLLYEYGLDEHTLENAITKVIEQRHQPLRQDHTAARLIAHRDSHIRKIPKKTLEKLIPLFASVHKTPDAVWQIYKDALENLFEARQDLRG